MVSASGSADFLRKFPCETNATETGEALPAKPEGRMWTGKTLLDELP
jgi:hypothetical protein